MSGLDITMLAHFSDAEAVLVIMVVFGPYALALAGLALSFFPRYKWAAFAMAILACGIYPVFVWLNEGLAWAFYVLFLKWSADALFPKYRLPSAFSPSAGWYMACSETSKNSHDNRKPAVTGRAGLTG